MADDNIQFPNPAPEVVNQNQDPPGEMQNPNVVPEGEVVQNVPQDNLEELKTELAVLKQRVESFTTATVETLLARLLEYAARPLSEFNKYDALAFTDSLQNRAHETKHEQKGYYRLVHKTLREKVDVPLEQFQTLVLRLLGDKDHEKVLNITTKVEKRYWEVAGTHDRLIGVPVSTEQSSTSSRMAQLRCFYCRRLGHIKVYCMQRKHDMAVRGRGRGRVQSMP